LIGFDIAIQSAFPIGPGWGVDPPPNSAGNPRRDQPSGVVREPRYIGCQFVLLKRPQFLLIPRHSNDCGKVEEHGQRGQQSTAVNAQKNQGESPFFLRRISTGIARDLGRGSSVFRCSTDSVEAKIVRSLFALPLHARR